LKQEKEVGALQKAWYERHRKEVLTSLHNRRDENRKIESKIFRNNKSVHTQSKVESNIGLLPDNDTISRLKQPKQVIPNNNRNK
jgi:hypothetical protein